MAVIHVIHGINIQLCMIILLIVTFEVPLLWVSIYWRKLFSSGQLNTHDVAEACAVVPVCYGHLETIHKCPDY